MKPDCPVTPAFSRLRERGACGFRLFVTIAIVGLTASLAQAEVSLKSVRWVFRQGAKVSMHKPKFVEADQWYQPPAGRIRTMPRVLVTIVNRGPDLAEGIVLRCAIRSRIVSVKEPNATGVWSVPMWVDRRKVLSLKPNQILDIPIDPAVVLRLETSLKEMYRAGFWPNSLNAQVMVEPRMDEDMEHKFAEKTLSVNWQSSGK